MELGILPIVYEIHKKMIIFLYHIITLPLDDPVLRLYNTMKQLPNEVNWANQVTSLRNKYKIDLAEDKIAEMDKKFFKKTVETKVKEYAFNCLLEECSSKAKTLHIKYTTLSCQKYLSVLNTTKAQLVARIRCNMLDIKSQRPYLFNKESINLCRHCANEPETISHVIKCTSVGVDIFEPIDDDSLNLLSSSVFDTDIAIRITESVEIFLSYESEAVETST